MSNAPPTTVRYVGLDVHKRTIHACILNAAGKVLGRYQLGSDRQSLLSFARGILQPGDLVALEATTNCWAVAAVLRAYVGEVVVSNPLATRAIARSKVKTDKVDAEVLAHLLRCGYLPGVWHPDQQTQRLRQLTGRRAALVQQRTALRNRIHSVLAMRLLEPPGDLFSSKGLAWLEELLKGGTLDEDAVLLIESDLRQLEQLAGEIDRFEDLLAREAYANGKVRLLMTLPGVDVTVAITLLAAIGDVSRFRTPKQLAAYLGLVPGTRQSAGKCYHTPITKQGNTRARWMLIQAAQHLGKNPGPLGNFFRRLKQRKNHNVAVVAAARKLAMIAAVMLKNDEPYRYAIPRSTETKLARLRVRVTGRKRRGGVRRGQKAAAKLPAGSRTIKSLDRIYAEEGLPARRQQLPPGEAKMLEQTATSSFVHSTQHDQLVPRRGSSRRT